MNKILKLLLIIIVVCGLIGWIGYFTKSNKEIVLDLGNYTVNEVNDNDVEALVSNADCGIRLLEDSKFVIYMGYGNWHNGNYEIKNNKLICKSVQLEWDGGAGSGNKPADVIFTFEIINENKLKLDNIEKDDTIEGNVVIEDGLKLGMTYSKKIEEINEEYSSIDDNYTQEELEKLYNKNESIEDTIYRKNYDIDNDGNLDLIEVIVKMKVKYVSELPIGHQYGVVGYDGGIDECIIKINGTTKNLGVMNPINNIEIIKENDVPKLKVDSSYRANQNIYYISYSNNEINVEVK